MFFSFFNSILSLRLQSICISTEEKMKKMENYLLNNDRIEVNLALQSPSECAANYHLVFTTLLHPLIHYTLQNRIITQCAMESKKKKKKKKTNHNECIEQFKQLKRFTMETFRHRGEFSSSVVSGRMVIGQEVNI